MSGHFEDFRPEPVTGRCSQCRGTGQEYPYGHEGEPEWLQTCGACDGTGEA